MIARLNLNSVDTKESLHSLESIVREAKSYDKNEFNKEAVRIVGKLTTSAEQENIESSRREIFRLVLWQPEQVVQSTPVEVKTRDLSIIEADSEPQMLLTTFFYDLGMTSLREQAGVVFITEGGYSELTNVGVFVPTSQTEHLHIGSQILSIDAAKIQ